MIPYKHIEPEIKTIGELINREDEQLITGLTEKQFLDVTWPKPDISTDGEQVKGLSNWERLQSMYGDEGSIDFFVNEKSYKDKKYSDIKIPLGTQFWLPEDNAVRETMFKLDTTVLQTSDFKAFLADEKARIFRDPDYAQIVEYGENGNIIVSNTGVTVYAFVKAAGIGGGSWVNLSAFVMNQQTFVGENGGNFTIDIAPIVGAYSGLEWGIDTDSIKGLSTAQYNDSYTAQAYINKVENQLLRRQQYFFHTVMQKNDLIFIKFEDLVKDRKRLSPINDFKLSGEEAASHDWDMIGLIDRTPQVVSSETNEINIRLQGRDLMKAYIEDDTIFFPEQEAGTDIFANEKDDEKLERRLYGEFRSFNTLTIKSVQFCLQFIVNLLSNTGYVPNTAFSGYDAAKLSRVNKEVNDIVSRFKLPKSSIGKKEAAEKAKEPKKIIRPVEADGVWKIIKHIVDDSVRERRVVDPSVFQGMGSMINFVRKICQDPWVEFFGDTYGNQYYLTARKSPWDFEGMKSLVYDQETYTETQQTVTFAGEEKHGLSGFSGSGVPGQQSLGEKIAESGTVLKEVIVTAFGVQLTRTVDVISDLCLSITDDMVLSEDLSYDDRAYSWYSLKPRGLMNGIEDESSWLLLSAVKFNRFVDVFGQKSLQTAHNYTTIYPYRDKNQASAVNIYEQQAINDLKYLVDSNAYLPFTRRGTITINGDRRFKKGLFIHYTPTNEVFYVDKVQQSRNITNSSTDRTTTLTVSRGMVEPYIKGKEIGGQLVSYFNIVSTEMGEVTEFGGGNKILANWKTNEFVFDFFLNRRQWASFDYLKDLFSPFDVNIKDIGNINAQFGRLS